jgi:hypothetical protein
MRTDQNEIDELLSGLKSLTNPDYHKLNVFDGRNHRLLHACLCAYAKHCLDCRDIGWQQLGDILHSAICNEIGDDEFCQWVDTMEEAYEMDQSNQG